MPSITAREAARLKGLGFRPIPIPAKEKGPRIKGWPNYQFDEATSDRDFPDGSNVGLIMGGELACVDLDHQSALDLAEGILPPTACVIGRPGRPRCHWFYRIEGEIKTTRFKVIILTDQSEEPLTVIDLQAGGTQMVVGPSIHPSGDIYDDMVGEPATVTADELMAAVAHLYTQAKAVLVANGVEIVEDTKPTKKPASNGEGAPSRSCPAGEAPGTAFNREHPGPLLIRHGWTLVSGGGGGKENWRRPGKDEGVSATLTPHNGGWQFYNFSSSTTLPSNENFSPPGLLAHLEHGGDFVAAARALRLAGFGDNADDADVDLSGLLGGKPLEPTAPKALPWKPLPVECLPDVLRVFVEAMATAFGVDPGWIAPACLTVVGGAIGRSRVIRVNPTWSEVPSLWLAVVGESGTKKSPILNRIVRPFWAIHKRLAKEYAQAMRKHLAAEELCVHKLEKATRDAAKNGGAIPDGLEELPVKPLEIRCMVSNATVQKLTAILAENPRGVFASYDELQTWFDSLGRFAQKNGNELSTWLPMDSGQALMSDTLTRGTVFVEHAFCAILGGIQPGLLKARFADSGFLDSGGAARFCLVEPPRTDPVWNEHGVPKEVDMAWDRLIEGLLGLKMEERNEGELVPNEIPISDKGKKVWVAWYEAHGKVTGAAIGHWGSFLSKIEAKAARLALVLCMADRVSRGRADDLSPIEAIWIEAGCLLADWFIQERLRIEAGWKGMDSGKPTLVDKVFIALRTAGAAGMTKTQLYELAGKATKKTVLDAVLLYLIGKGLVRKETVPPKGGPPSERFLVV